MGKGEGGRCCLSGWEQGGRRKAQWLCISFLELPDNMPPIGWLNTTEIYPFTILEPRNLKSRWQQGHAASEGCRGELFHASPLAAAVSCNLWCSLACRCLFPISVSLLTWHSSRVSPHYLPFVHVGLCVSSFLIRIIVPLA